jgi:asparagine synthase (glutamine-hydrolysing)
VIEDKVSMAHSLESRVPFLDDDLVEFAVGVPLSLKIENLAAAGAAAGNENLFGIKHRAELTTHSDGKAILRAAMARLIPPEVSARAKQGFSAPDASWFRGESIDYINRLLRQPRARIYDYLSPEYVHDALEQHCSGTSNRRLLIWSLLSFEWWLKNFFD